MLPAKNRLKKKKDIDRVFKQGRIFKEGFLFIKLVKNNLKVNRFAFIVGLKVSKKAVLRNKLKRRLREIVKTKLAKTKTGFDVSLTALKGLEKQNFQQITETIDKVFKKAKL